MLVCLSVLVFVFTGFVESDFKLSASKLLLPFHSFIAVNYTLLGSNGACYEWGSATPEVATVTPVFETNPECSKSAFVTAVWQSPHRAVTTIHARVLSKKSYDSNAHPSFGFSDTGHVVKCDVIVDNIYKIEIETTTQELYLHNTPESLAVVGYDEFGNTFSTLDGVPFEWKIHGDTYSGAGDGHSVLRFLTWTESEYATPPGIARLEERGLQGSMQLVSGLRTGSAVVEVSLSENMYSTVKASQVRLLVMANAQLSPALAYLMPGSEIKLRVRVVQQGSDQDVEEALENLRSVLYADSSGETDSKLPRRRLPTSLVHIVEPAYFGFSMVQFSSSDSELCRIAVATSVNTAGEKPTRIDASKAGRDWVMEVGKLYTFVVDLYDQNSHRIYPTDNIRITLQSPSDKVKFVEQSKNGTYSVLTPLQHGPVQFEVSFDHIVTKLCGAGKVVVTSPASIRFVSGPAEVVITDQPIHAESNPTKLPSHRTDNNTATDASVLTVGIAVLDQQGRIMTDCRHLNIPVRPLDSSVVKVLPDRLPPLLDENASVTVERPQACVRLLVVASKVGFTELEATFDPLENLENNSADSHSKRTESASILSTRFSVAVYRPIKFLNPASAKTYVAAGSTRTILFSRGARPWPLEPASYFTRIAPLVKEVKQHNVDVSHPMVSREPEPWKPSNPEEIDDVLGAQIDRVSLLSNEHSLRPMVFDMRCRSVGTFEFLLQTGNQPSSKNPIPLVMSSKFTVVCDVAEKLRLVLYRPILRLPSGVPACPLLNSSTPEPSDVLSIPNTVPFVVGLVLFNGEGIKLDAADSLPASVTVTDASSSNPSVLVLDTKPAIKLLSDPALTLLGQPSRPYVIVRPRKLGLSSGLLTIRAEVRSSSMVAGVPLSSSLNIRLNPTAKLLSGGYLRAIHHPKADASFSVLGGSGYFFLSTTPDTTQMAQPPLQLIPIENTGVGVPVADGIPLHSYRIQSGQVGQSEIHVLDRCFPSMKPSLTGMQPVDLMLTVDIVGLAGLRLQAADRIPLGGLTSVVVKAVDSRGDQLPQNLAQFLDVRVYQSSDFSDVTVTTPKILGLPDGGVLSSSSWISSSGISTDPGHTQFDVRGMSLGSATLIASTETFALDSSQLLSVKSNPIDMQVFAPLSLSPCSFNLLVGAEYELRATGGPQPALIEFTVDSDESDVTKRVSVIRMSKNSVLIRAGTILGYASVRARAVSLSSRTNASDLGSQFSDVGISSEAICFINVVTLSGIRIGCPLASATESLQVSSGGHSKAQSDDQRFIIACRSEESSRNCGVAPLWAEGLATSITAERGTWVHRPALASTNAEPNRTTNDRVSPLSMSGVNPPLRFIWQLDPPQPTSAARLAHVLDTFNAE
ncbi:hypothetical protein FGIG_06344 [Fasciola gigantica]|uniref:Nuclear pore membrane glycoprotein n=1 Tax=Fasciola gigantica TaxID=46835 RepID=A0A504YXW3_FASGI|nr:hypothetical protein FGIG_06344 [Fasciola gigantica]